MAVYKRNATKAAPSDMTAKWFHDNVYEILEKAIRVTFTKDLLTKLETILNAANDCKGLAGPGIDGILTVTDSTALEVKVGATALADRKLVYIQPLDGKIWFGFDNGVTKNNGFILFKKQLKWFSAASTNTIYIISDTGSTQVAVAEVP